MILKAYLSSQDLCFLCVSVREGRVETFLLDGSLFFAKQCVYVAVVIFILLTPCFFAGCKYLEILYSSSFCYSPNLNEKILVLVLTASRYIINIVGIAILFFSPKWGDIIYYNIAYISRLSNLFKKKHTFENTKCFWIRQAVF